MLRWPKLKLSAKTRNILVTGCDTGFGNLFARRLDKKGYCVFAGCLTSEGVTSLRETCSHRAKPFLLDVRREDSVINAVKFVESRTPSDEGLWALVNNAGVSGPYANVTWCNRKDYDDVFKINFHGVRHMCEAFLPMLKQSRGRRVNTASIMGHIAVPYGGPYCVSKHAVEAFSDALRREICHFGISVHIIEPSFFKTNATDFSRVKETFLGKWNNLPDEVKHQYGESYPTKCLDVFREDWKSVSTELDLVVDAYEHATLAVRPHSRYHVGWAATLFFIPLSLLPDWIGDKILTAPSLEHH